MIRALRTTVAIATVASLAAACTLPTPHLSTAGPPAPPAPARNTAAVDDPADHARFACAVRVQQAQNFDPGASLHDGTLIGALIGGAAGASLGALFGLIGDIPGRAAALGAIVGGGIGITAGGIVKLGADTATYERGLEACIAAQLPAPVAPAGLVEYRLRVVSVWNAAFTSYLGAEELADGVAGPGLVRLATVADAGDLARGVVIYDRHLVAVAAPVAHAFGAVPVDAGIKKGGARRDFWGEARWYGVPGERSVWMISSRNRRPQEVRRIALSDVAALAQFRPVRPPFFGAKPEAAVALPLSTIDFALTRDTAGALVDRVIDGSRAIAAVVARNDDAAFPDRVYLIVRHATSAATYEAVLAWGERAVERGATEMRGD